MQNSLKDLRYPWPTIFHQPQFFIPFPPSVKNSSWCEHGEVLGDIVGTLAGLSEALSGAWLGFTSAASMVPTLLIAAPTGGASLAAISLEASGVFAGAAMVTHGLYGAGNSLNELYSKFTHDSTNPILEKPEVEEALLKQKNLDEKALDLQITTEFGTANQIISKEALDARFKVMNGQPVYRYGTKGFSFTGKDA